MLGPVDDPPNLDARRAELSLPPIAEYLQNEYLVKACAQAAKRSAKTDSRDAPAGLEIHDAK